MSRQVPDRVPRDSPGFTPGSWETYKKNAGDADPVVYFKGDSRGLSFKPSTQNPDYKRYFIEKGLDADKMRIDDFGVGYTRSKNTDFHYEHFISPLSGSNNLNDFIDYPLPDYEAAYRTDHFPEESAQIHNEGLACIGPMQMTLFEKAVSHG